MSLSVYIYLSNRYFLSVLGAKDSVVSKTQYTISKGRWLQLAHTLPGHPSVHGEGSCSLLAPSAQKSHAQAHLDLQIFHYCFDRLGRSPERAHRDLPISPFVLKHELTLR